MDSKLIFRVIHVFITVAEYHNSGENAIRKDFVVIAKNSTGRENPRDISDQKNRNHSRNQRF